LDVEPINADANRLPATIMHWPTLILLPILILAAWLPSACTRFSPPDIPPDGVAEKMAAELRQTNADLTRFKIVGKMTLSGPNRPAQAFRAAMAGQLSNRLRIDMFAPFGGSAGTVASDGKHLYLVMHPTREYYTSRFGNGNLRRLIRIDVSVSDLLALLVGRIPVDPEYSAHLMPAGQMVINGKADEIDEETVRSDLVFVDRKGRIRQRISLDDHMRPVRSVWLNSSQDPVFALTFTGHQVIKGFVLPRRIDLSAQSGERVSMVLDRYEANARLDENLFSPTAPSS
jgi:hypothetical protein